MKKYPAGIRETVVSRIRAGESQCKLSREYGINRCAIQHWPFLRNVDANLQGRSKSTNMQRWKIVVTGFSAIHGKEVRASVKYQIIEFHSHQYAISVMCHFFGVSRSGYYDFLKRQGYPEKDAVLAEHIREQ